MKKKQTPEQELRGLIESLRREFSQHASLKEYGGQDPFYPDGVNMNLVRNHIIYDKRKILELCSENGFELPDEYFIPTPDKVDNGYMANLNQKERVKRLIQHGDKLTTKKTRYDNQTSFL